MRHTRKRNRKGGTAYHYMMKRMGFHPTIDPVIRRKQELEEQVKLLIASLKTFSPKDKADAEEEFLQRCLVNLPDDVLYFLLKIKEVARINHFMDIQEFFNDVICPNIQILSEIDNQFNTKYPKLYLRWLIGYGQDLDTDTDGNINYKFTAENKKNVDLQQEEGKAQTITDKDIISMFLVYLSQVEDKRNEKAKAIIKAREPDSIPKGGKKHKTRKYKKYNKKRKHRASRRRL